MKKWFLASLLLTNVLYAADTLRVISAGPAGEVASLAEANEVRVVFSEPMVVLGRIPATVTAPYFHITPPVRGAFRWSGTTTLIFTPESLPYARRYDVTIDATVKSVAGNTMPGPYTFSFTTPAVRLKNTFWQRKPNGAVDIALTFNQPVDANVIVQHLKLRTAAHAITPPAAPDQASPEFEKKKAAALQAAASNGAPVFAFLAPGAWFTPGPDTIVLETKPGIPSDTNIEVVLDPTLRNSPRDVTPGVEQTYTIQLEPTLFVDGLQCVAECDPDRSNVIKFRDAVGIDVARKNVSVTDVTDPKFAKAVVQKNVDTDVAAFANDYTFDDLGYVFQPAHKYAVRVDPALQSSDGQTLGYVWTGTVDVWHRFAFISFGDGQGVWESSGGPVLPFHARNFRTVQQWLAPLTIEQMMPTLQQLRTSNTTTPPGTPQNRTLAPAADKIQSFGLDMKQAIGNDNRGLVWAAIKPVEPIAKAHVYDTNVRSTVVQVTNLGISVKDSPQNVLVYVTTLDNAKPVAGANVSIRNRDNAVVWTGKTDERGVAVAADVKNLRYVKPKKPRKDDEDWEASWSAMSGLHFIVVAEKDGDVAYAGSDWNEGVQPWEFDTRFDINEARPLLRGTVFTDRGVYKLGEEVHFKIIVRSDTPAGMQLLPGGTKVDVTLTDSHAKPIDKRTLTLNEWSSAEWTYRLPSDAPLGSYTVNAKAGGQRLAIYGTFLVAAYRRPDFRVDTTLSGPSMLAGTQLDGRITARYLHGGVMAGRDVTWTYSKRMLYDVPDNIRDRFPTELYAFLGTDGRDNDDRIQISTRPAKLDAKGELALKLDTAIDAGWPLDYELEGDVTDVTRQHIAGRASFRVDPAPWYVGLKRNSFFYDAKTGFDTEVVAAALDATARAGVDVTLTLTRVNYNSVRRATGNGFYEWDTERKDVGSGEWHVTTAAQPVPFHIPLTAGGEYVLEAKAGDLAGHSTTTHIRFYATGGGYTAWERYDHNRIDLVPEKKTYRPGDTARIMIKSPWEKATALLTTEREGVRTSTPFQLTSTQQTITVPITEADIPNVFVSVLLVKGRTKISDPRSQISEEESDPGKPAFRLGYTELTVVDAVKRLNVSVKANRDEYRPASKANIDVNVRDAAGAPSQSEVTLWAVDYGVLSLTAYQTPDVLDSIYVPKALEVLTEDTRQRIVSRRVITPKGAGEGGGGGREAGPGTMRKDFRVLAFWIGSVVTDANGRAKTTVTLPESLTTYRIMAVAGDRASRFGWAQNEIKVNKPLMLMAAFQRFMSVGDTAYFGGSVNSQKISGKATVTIRSLDPSVLDFAQPSTTVDVKPNSAVEARFEAVAKAIGTARVQMTVKLGRESDAFEDTIPVRVLVSPETVAAYGEAKPQAKETLEVPQNVVPGFGGLHLELSSTAMVGLGEGAEYLVTYPYGCAEQRASGALALVLTSDLGEAFHLPGIDAASGKKTAQSTLHELEKFQCGDGGFAYWPGQCSSESPYLTAYVLHVNQRAQKLGYAADKDMLKRAYEYLDRQLNVAQPVNEGWWPEYTAWQAFAIKTLAEGGRNVDSHVNRIYPYVDRMPVFGIAHLADAMVAKGEKGPRLDELHRRMLNAILPEGGQAHVEELTDPNLLWLWNSNVRSTAIVLGTLVRQEQDEEIVKRIVRWLMAARKDGGRWNNTQENAWAMESLIDYYRRYESEVPDFIGVATAGTQTIAREEFRGRSTVAKTKDLPMREVQSLGTTVPVVFDRQGTGTLFYLLRLRYAPTDMKLQPLDAGFQVQRTYRVHGVDAAATSFKAGDLIEVTLHVRNTKERRFVAVTDPIPAGTEPVETAFATTSVVPGEEQQRNDEQGTWDSWWMHGGFDYIERHDDRVDVFATRLDEGDHDYKYLLRATTGGTFIAAPAHAEEMYEPEVFGRTATAVVEVKR